MTVVPLNSEVLSQLIHAKKEKLQGRIQGHTMQPDDVLLTSSTQDLQRFLLNHMEDRNLFPADLAIKFHRK